MMFCDVMVFRSLTAIRILYVVAYLAFIVMQLRKTGIVICLSSGIETFMVVGISLIYNFGADLHHNSFLSQMGVIGVLIVLTLLSVGIAQIPKVKTQLARQVTRKPNYAGNAGVVAILILVIRPIFRVLGNTLSESQKIVFAIIVLCPLFMILQIYMTAYLMNRQHLEEQR